MAHANATVEELVSKIERGESLLSERVITWIPSSLVVSATLWRWGRPIGRGHQLWRVRCNDASINSIEPPGGWSGRNREGLSFL